MRPRFVAVLGLLLLTAAARGQGRMPPAGPNWTYPQGFGYRWTTPPSGISPGTRGLRYNGMPQPPTMVFPRRSFRGPQPFLIDTYGIDRFGRPLVVDQFGRVFFIDAAGRLRDERGRMLPRMRVAPPRYWGFSGPGDFRVLD